MSQLTLDVKLRVDSLDLAAAVDTPLGDVTALFGPSGSGKTTLLRIIAGLERKAHGLVRVGEETWQDSARGLFVPPHARRVGFVFQDTRLFAHLSVEGNLLYGHRRTPVAERALTPAEVIEVLELAPLLARRVTHLSGGERQRVAIGRALLTSPRLLLMDEPLASLDEARRAEILPYIERLRDQAGVPILYVSHSVAEVARLATPVVILTEGKVTAVGPVLDILPLADAGDGGSVLDAVVARHDEAFQLTVLTSAAGELQVPRLAAPAGAPVRAYIRARDVMLSLKQPEEISALNVLAGHVAQVTPNGSGAQADIRLDCNGAILMARLTAKSVDRLALVPGRPVYAVIKSVSFERS